MRGNREEPEAHFGDQRRAHSVRLPRREARRYELNGCTDQAPTLGSKRSGSKGCLPPSPLPLPDPVIEIGRRHTHLRGRGGQDLQGEPRRGRRCGEYLARRRRSGRSSGPA